MMNMKLKTFGDSLESRWIYYWNLWGRYGKYYAAGDFENKSDSRSLVPGNQNGSGYKCISLAFSTKENLGIDINLAVSKTMTANWHSNPKSNSNSPESNTNPFSVLVCMMVCVKFWI